MLFHHSHMDIDEAADLCFDVLSKALKQDVTKVVFKVKSRSFSDELRHNLEVQDFKVKAGSPVTKSNGTVLYPIIVDVPESYT